MNHNLEKVIPKIDQDQATGNGGGKKPLILLLILLVVGVVIVAFFVVPADVSDIKGDDINVTKIDTTELPDRFPTNVPLDPEAKILQNYSASTGDGRFQATRKFETSKSLQENFNVYKEYLGNFHWIVTIHKDTPTEKYLSGVRTNDHLDILIQEQMGLDKRTIEITFVSLPN